MNRLRILKEFGKVAQKERLDSDEVRLYLLLLANWKARNHGEIEYRTIKCALGKQFSMAKLRRACSRLSKRHLIEIITPLDDMTARDFTIVYKIFPITGFEKT